MSKEKEIVLVFRDILTRINTLADAAEKEPIDIELIKSEKASYLESYEERKALLALPASEVTSNFMFKLMYGSFSETMNNLLNLLGLYYNNITLFYEENAEESLKETIQEFGEFRKECNKRFKKVEAQLSSIGNVE